MATEETRELVTDVIAGKMSRREFAIKALALGMSTSGIAAVLTTLSTPVAAQASAYALVVSLSADRSNPSSLAGKTVSGNIYVFTTPGSGVSRVRFYLDDPNMGGTPRRVEGNPPHNLAGGVCEHGEPVRHQDGVRRGAHHQRGGGAERGRHGGGARPLHRRQLRGTGQRYGGSQERNIKPP